MATWRNLQVIEEENPQNPNDGNPYVLFNPSLNKVWIFMGITWLLETGKWKMEDNWCNGGTWKYFNEIY